MDQVAAGHGLRTFGRSGAGPLQDTYCLPQEAPKGKGVRLVLLVLLREPCPACRGPPLCTGTRSLKDERGPWVPAPRAQTAWGLLESRGDPPWPAVRPCRLLLPSARHSVPRAPSRWEDQGQALCCSPPKGHPLSVGGSLGHSSHPSPRVLREEVGGAGQVTAEGPRVPHVRREASPDVSTHSLGVGDGHRAPRSLHLTQISMSEKGTEQVHTPGGPCVPQ